MAKIYSNCSSCSFISESEDNCTLGKWQSFGFGGKVKEVENNGKKEMHLQGRICTFHRTENWKSHYEKMGVDVIDKVNEENTLKYGLVSCIDDVEDPELMLAQVTDVANSKFKPSTIYIVNNCSNPKYSNDYLKSFLSTFNIPFKIKKTLTENTNAKFIDEFAMTDRLVDHFYLGLLKPGFDIKFLDNLYHVIYQEMLQVMFAGDEESYYYMPTNLHKLCSCGFAEFTTREVGPEAVFSYSKIMSLKP